MGVLNIFKLLDVVRRLPIAGESQLSGLIYDVINHGDPGSYD
jgi:hypothetical protein